MEEGIQEVLEYFDFQRVHKVMEFLNWTWGYEEVPSIYKLIKEAERLLTDVSKRKEDWYLIATGGFEATKCGDSLSLKFVLEQSESESN
jgi:hypothetical protein